MVPSQSENRFDLPKLEKNVPECENIGKCVVWEGVILKHVKYMWHNYIYIYIYACDKGLILVNDMQTLTLSQPSKVAIFEYKMRNVLDLQKNKFLIFAISIFLDMVDFVHNILRKLTTISL